MLGSLKNVTFLPKKGQGNVQPPEAAATPDGDHSIHKPQPGPERRLTGGQREMDSQGILSSLSK